MKLLNKIKNFFIKILPSRRKIIQLYAALLYNAHIRGFISGEIFTGATKNICVPGLNCYSCPGAIGACPLGSLQNALAESKTKLPTYILGIILLYMIIFGRTICGFLCPIGLFQELLYKIKTPKVKKSKFTKVLSYLKYVILIVFVIIMPLIYGLQQLNIPLPAFCKYICPAGLFEGAIFLLANPNNTGFYGMLGSLFTWKFILLICFIVLSVFFFRFFCRFICPLGALYGLFNKIALLGVKVNDEKCNHCQACVSFCKMDITTVGDSECIQCGECIDVCHNKAISWKLVKEKVHAELEIEKMNMLKGIENIEDLENKEDDVKSIDVVKNKKSKKKIIISLVAVILLVVLFIFVNFSKKIYNISDTCSDLVIELDNGTTYETSKDTNSTLLYFYNNLTNEELMKIRKYAQNEKITNYSKYKLNIILVGTNDAFDTLDENSINELSELNIFVATDTKNAKLAKSFIKELTYPYSIYLDVNDKILLKENKLIDNVMFESTIVLSMLGYNVGNQVGDLCINKDIPLIGKDETFSVLDNRGKITIINFWFISCTPCVKELPYFNQVYEEYSDQLSVIAIHEAGMYQSKKQEVFDFINNQFKDFTIMFGYDDINSSYYKALCEKETFPTTIIADQEGIISFVCLGPLSEEELRSEVTKLLK